MSPETNAENADGSPNDRDNRHPTTTSFLSALTAIPQFSGHNKTTIREFIKSVSAVGKLTKCTDEQLAELAKLKLTGLANAFLESQPELEVLHWTALSASLKTRFGDPEGPQAKRYLLRDCTQNNSETVRDYLIRLKQIGYLTIKPTENDTEKKIREEIMQEELLEQFMRGININLRHAVYSANPTTLEKAAVEAQRQERFINSKTKTQSVLAIKPTIRNSDNLGGTLSLYEHDYGRDSRPMNDLGSGNHHFHQRPPSQGRYDRSAPYHGTEAGPGWTSSGARYGW